MDTQILSDIGFSDREILVYTSLIKLGPTTTGPLVKESGVQNSKVYETLEKLIKKGSVSYKIIGKTKYFQANDPGSILNFFDERKEKLEKTVALLKNLSKKNQAKTETRVYEGIRAIKSALFEMYDYIGKGSEYYVFPIGEELGREELVMFFAQVFQKRIKMNIKVNTLPNIRLKKIFQKHYQNYKLIDIRYTTQEFPTGTFIFKDHVLNIIWGEKPVAFLIKSEENSLRWQAFFKEQWDKAAD